MELDSHLLTTGMVMLTRVLLMMARVTMTRLLTPCSLSPLIVRLSPEGPGLDGHHGGGVGVHEAGQGVDRRHGGGGGALLRGPGYPRRCGASLPGVVVEGLGDELGVELLDPGLTRPLRPLGHVSEGPGLCSVLGPSLGGARLPWLPGGRGGPVLRGVRQTRGGRLSDLGHVVILTAILLTKYEFTRRSILGSFCSMN